MMMASFHVGLSFAKSIPQKQADWMFTLSCPILINDLESFSESLQV